MNWDVLAWIVWGILAVIGCYIFIRLMTFAVLNSINDSKRRKGKENGSDSEGR